MPGSTIGDGSVIGANSLVSGNIPPNSLAVGSPAKVIRSAPDFPRQPNETERAKLVQEMMGEFERFLEYNGVSISREGAARVYRYRKGEERLHWRTQSVDTPAVGSSDTVMTEIALTEAELADYRRRKVFWLDLQGRTRSLKGSALTEELAQFLGRYGIRLARDRSDR
jgi:hypothetical protein